MNANKTAVGQTSLCNAIKEMGSRLTHLHLAHNRLSGIPQIVKALAVSVSSVLKSKMVLENTFKGAFLPVVSSNGF